MSSPLLLELSLNRLERLDVILSNRVPDRLVAGPTLSTRRRVSNVLAHLLAVYGEGEIYLLIHSFINQYLLGAYAHSN